MSLPKDWVAQLRLPVVVAPMFLVSGVELVIASSCAGLVGTFPAANARTLEELEAWFDAIEAACPGLPYAVNVTLARKGADPYVEAVLRRRPPIVITSVGQPTDIVKRVHDYGGLVFHDVTTLRHAQKAAEAGVDGLILVCAGAGGHGGLVTPFALVPQVRAMFEGLIILGGAVTEGSGILASQALGADLAYMGSRFIATEEAMASPQYKAMMVAAETKDVVYTPAISGLPANFIRQSIEAAGLDPANLPAPLALLKPNLPEGVKAWKDIWSAGQGVGLINHSPNVATLVDELEAGYRRAHSSLRVAR